MNRCGGRRTRASPPSPLVVGSGASGGFGGSASRASRTFRTACFVCTTRPFRCRPWCPGGGLGNSVPRGIGNPSTGPGPGVASLRSESDARHGVQQSSATKLRRRRQLGCHASAWPAPGLAPGKKQGSSGSQSRPGGPTKNSGSPSEIAIPRSGPAEGAASPSGPSSCPESRPSTVRVPAEGGSRLAPDGHTADSLRPSSVARSSPKPSSLPPASGTSPTLPRRDRDARHHA